LVHLGFSLGGRGRGGRSRGRGRRGSGRSCGGRGLFDLGDDGLGGATVDVVLKDVLGLLLGGGCLATDLYFLTTYQALQEATKAPEASLCRRGSGSSVLLDRRRDGSRGKGEERRRRRSREEAG